MKPIFSRQLVTASALAIAMGLGYAGAQQSPTPADPMPQGQTQDQSQNADDNPGELSPEAQQEARQAANNNQPLSAETPVSPGMPDSFATLVEKVAPAVVNITTTSVVSRPASQDGGPSFPEGSPFSDLFRDFGFGPQGPEGGPRAPMGPQRSNALGSGFVISAEGFIVTNNHVIDGADEIEIEFYSGERLPAEVIGTDPNTDIAVLKVDSPDPLPFVEFGDSDSARVGDWVLALGNPLGQGFSASTGIVSARNRELSGTYDDYLQTDAAINRGNSGGPLFDMNGRVVGVNTAILSPSGGSIGIGFSMASNVVSSVVDQLREYGETRRGWLGVKIQDVTPDMAEAMGLAAENGAMVTDVPEGPARDAGMEAGDVITSFDGGEVEDTRSLVRRVADAPAGEAVEVIVQRNGEPMTLSVTLGRRELAEGNGTASVGSSEDPETQSNVLGMQLSPLSPELAAELGVSRDMQGLVVQAVDPEGDAAEKGIAAGDIITEAGQQPVTSMSDMEDRISEARDAGRKSILVLIRRAGEPRFVALPIAES
ncbi:Do family serine endopeptidase [Paracoccus sp. TK19116]|uniref:Probable periplasmic serine endoprotease DegP-like n=1 Tax=Paracoccus albicereus TaxID=2922394 RepID=A0ABT1MNH6_9RHOB|nr:Do family serine endopeptidase [Paracoccus albicereus]MCQ0969847.1 Do family serine endopeptidase [Paracoccus albicereus]